MLERLRRVKSGGMERVLLLNARLALHRGLQIFWLVCLVQVISVRSNHHEVLVFLSELRLRIRL